MTKSDRPLAPTNIVGQGESNFDPELFEPLEEAPEEAPAAKPKDDRLEEAYAEISRLKKQRLKISALALIVIGGGAGHLIGSHIGQIKNEKSQKIENFKFEMRAVNAETDLAFAQQRIEEDENIIYLHEYFQEAVSKCHNTSSSYKEAGRCLEAEMRTQEQIEVKVKKLKAHRPQSR